MASKIRIDGIYDKRTLTQLFQCEVRDFCFDFSPKSFNFIQEEIFLQLLPLINEMDRIFIHFCRSNDPMVMKLTHDMQKIGINLDRVFFEFDSWSEELPPEKFPFNFMLYYSPEFINWSKIESKNYRGLIFKHSFFEPLIEKNLLQNFSANFYTRLGHNLSESHLMILQLNWSDKKYPSLFDFFDFDLIALPISSDIEVCYRNVNLKKLNSELILLNKTKLLRKDF